MSAEIMPTNEQPHNPENLPATSSNLWGRKLRHAAHFAVDSLAAVSNMGTSVMTAMSLEAIEEWSGPYLKYAVPAAFGLLAVKFGRDARYDIEKLSELRVQSSQEYYANHLAQLATQDAQPDQVL